jgi:multicomponent Na+:H+ antiporter subunit D
VFRIFFGWGDAAPEDEASRVEERPETKASDEGVPAVMFVPAAILILLGIAICGIPQLRSSAEAAGRLFTDQSTYQKAVMDNVQPAKPDLAPAEELTSSIVRGCSAGVLALLLALATVFRTTLGKAFDFTRALELGYGRLRELHSGHPGDYVAWVSFGTAVVGAMFAWLLR